LEHPECFDEEEGSDWEQLTLALAMMYQLTLGKKSYWYPYLRQMPDVDFASCWNDFDMDMTQDEHLSK